MVEYSSHDWRKYTDDAIVKDEKSVMKVNESVVIFTDPKERKTYEVDVSRLIRVFVNNRDDNKRSVK
jgi:hypothetical protein